MAILPDRSELTTPADGDLYMTTDVSDTTDAATGTDKKITWANIKAALLTYFNTVYQPLSAVLTATTASFTTALETKLGYISVTQAVDLDQMEADIAALANGMVYKGNWDASAGSFPGAGAAQTGWFYTVSVGGTVDGVVFNAGDRLIAIVDNASATTYAANWTQLDATDAVTSVDSAIGNVDLATILFAKTAKTTPVDADTMPMTDSAASNVLKKVTWANIKATLKTYFDTLYVLATAKFTLVTPATDETAEGFQLGSFNAGATIAKFQAVYMGSASKWLLTDASATATADKALAIALEAGTDGNPLDVALPGTLIRDDTWNWTIGGAIYLSETAGALTQTAPTTTDAVIRVVGYAYSADVMYFMPETGVVHV